MSTRVSVSDYRANLKLWHEVAAGGEDVLVSERGRVVVRVTSPESAATLDALEREGVLRRGRHRPAAGELDMVPAPGDSTASVSKGRDR